MKNIFASITLGLILCSNTFAEEPNFALVQSLFKPLPTVADNPNNPITDAKVALGKKTVYGSKAF